MGVYRDSVVVIRNASISGKR